MVRPPFCYMSRHCSIVGKNLNRFFPEEGGEIVAEGKYGGRFGHYEESRNYAFVTNMSEFSQISRLQEENRKVKMFCRPTSSPICFFFTKLYSKFAFRPCWNANNVFSRGEPNCWIILIFGWFLGRILCL